MSRYLIRRIPSAILVLFLASALIFAIIRLIPGDPATTLAGPDASPATVAGIRHHLGLDRSIPVQYGHWLGQVLTGHLGRSYLIGGTISSLVAQSFGHTVLLTLSALLVALVVALIAGPLWATTRNRFLEGALTATNTAAIALPTFVTGVLLVLVFGVLVPILPTGGTPPEGLTANIGITAQYLLMPAICLALPVAAVLSRYLAETLRTELNQPYVTTALALGVSRRRLLWRHALRNVLPTTLTVLGIQVGALLGGAVLVEAIFAWPGVGQLIQQAISRRDYPVVQVLLLLAVGVFVVIQLLTDIAHVYLDPRVRIGGHLVTDIADAGVPTLAEFELVDSVGTDPAVRSGRSRALVRGRGLVGLLLVGVVFALGLLAPVIAPYGPNVQIPNANLLSASGSHLFGTDQVDRDVLSRVLYGIRVDVIVVFVAVPLGALIGSLAGVLASTIRPADVAVQRVFDVLLAFPPIILAIGLTAVLGTGIVPIVVVVTLVEIPMFGRLLRSSVLKVRELPFVEASEAIGAGRWWIMRRHVLPNAAEPLFVQLALSMSVAIFLESAMSFLGIGVRPPKPSLGNIVADSVSNLDANAMFAVGPLLVVAALVLGFQLIAQAVGAERRR